MTGEHPDPGEFLARFPQVAPALRRVLDIHGLVGSGSTQARAGLLRHGDRLGRARLRLSRGRADHRRLLPGRGARARGVRPGLPGAGARAGGSAGGPEGDAARLARAADPRPPPAHAHRAGPLAPDRQGHGAAPPLHALLRPDDPGAGAGRCPRPGDTARASAWSSRSIGSSRPSRPPAASSGRAALGQRSYDRAIAWWGARMAEALEHAHERGVLHRDIKPSNVLVTADGMPMLLDFNLAREPLADDGPAETPPHRAGPSITWRPSTSAPWPTASPRAIDQRSDIYSLGVVLYEALTGCRPFAAPRRGGSLVEALAARGRGPQCEPARPAIDRARGPAGARRRRPPLPRPRAGRSLPVRRRARRRPAGRGRRPAAGLRPRADFQPRRRLAPAQAAKAGARRRLGRRRRSSRPSPSSHTC